MALGLPENLLAGLAQGGGSAPVTPAPADEPDPTALRSTKGGTVVKWLVESGATVAEGEALLVLEAMKMESTVVAHRSGTLVGFLVAEGDAVTVNAVVAGIEA